MKNTFEFVTGDLSNKKEKGRIAKYNARSTIAYGMIGILNNQ